MTTARSAELTAALTAHGLDETLTDHTGTTITDAWNQAFAVLDQPAPSDPVELVYEHLGTDLDIGRHRGGPWLVWHNPDLDPWLDAEGGQWLRVDEHPEGWDNPKFALAAHFHTRNGGGNRECCCTDGSHGHEPGCLVLIVDRLAAHPAYLYDADDDFDSTYANFYFAVPRTDAVRAAVDSEAQRRERSRAQSMLDQIASGQRGPWDVFESNPSTVALHEDTRAAATAPVGDVPRLRTSTPNGPASAKTALVDLDAHIAYLDGTSADLPTFHGDAWTSIGVQLTAVWRTNTEQYRVELDDHKRTMDDLEAGRLPEYVARVLPLAEVSKEVAHLSHQVEVYGRCVDESLRALKADRAVLAVYVDAMDARDGAKERAGVLVWSLRWPGSPDTCPPRPVAVSGQDDQLVGF